MGTEAECEDCPGSYIFLGEASRKAATGGDQAKLDRAMQQWQLATQIKEHLAELADEDQARRNTDMPTDPDSRFLGFPVGRRHPVGDMEFPGRPADSEDMGPQPGDKPRWKPPMNMLTGESGPLGRAAMDNAHATTKELLLLTLSKLVECANAVGRVSAMVEQLDGVVNEVSTHAEAASALCASTVGYGDGAPEAAGRLAGHVQDVRVRASVEHGGELISAVTGLNHVVHGILESLAGAATAGEDYQRTLSQ